MTTVAPVPVSPALARKIRQAAERRHHWTEEHERLVVAALDEGASLREIAELANVSHQTIKNIAARRRT